MLFSGDRSPTVLSELDRSELEGWAIQNGLPAFRGRQLWRALATRSAQDVSELTDLPRDLRDRLAMQYRIRTLDVLRHVRSEIDGAEKVLFGLQDGATVETVLIPGRDSGGGTRHTVCVSSQVGCPAGCSFCATGLSGFGRNLTAGEIVDQVAFFAHDLAIRRERVSNVVFMGMGEPLLNVPAVRAATQRLTDPAALGLGARHMTISTVGIVPQIRNFAAWSGQVNLAISLHAPNDALRSRLVPYNRHFPIPDLLDAVRTYVGQTRRRVSFEYVLLKGVNDALPLADELASLLRPFGGLAHVNLIPWNPFREGKFVRSEGPDAEAFVRALNRNRVNSTIRYSRGLDITAACGQLRDSEAGHAAERH